MPKVIRFIIRSINSELSAIWKVQNSNFISMLKGVRYEILYIFIFWPLSSSEYIKKSATNISKSLPNKGSNLRSFSSFDSWRITHNLYVNFAKVLPHVLQRLLSIFYLSVLDKNCFILYHKSEFLFKVNSAFDVVYYMKPSGAESTLITLGLVAGL